MDEKKLKEVFELMFKKLESISIDDNFISDINRRRRVVFDKNKPDSFFYERSVTTIHVSGFRVSVLRNRWDDIKKAFSDYDINKVSQYTNKDLEKMMDNSKLVRNKKKLKACIENAKIMKNISKEYDSFGEFLGGLENNLRKLREELRANLKYLGPVLVHDYLKEIGIDSIKPDVHVIRVMHRLGLIDSEKISSDNIDRVVKIAEKMSRATGEKLNVIDAIFWMYGGGGDNHVKKAICSKNQPSCGECPLIKYCIFYSRKVGTESLFQKPM